MMKAQKFLLVVLFAITQSVIAQDRSYNIYLDTDFNINTGCTVPQPDFSTQFKGIDAYISVVTSDSPATILTSTYFKCLGNNFDTGSANVDSALGLNTSVSADDVFEMQLPFAELGLNSSTLIRLYYSVESPQSSDILTLDNGQQIVVGINIPTNIPFLSAFSLLILTVIFLLVARSAHSKKFATVAIVLAYSSLVWAMTFIIDGQTNDWANENAIVDAIGDNSSPGNYSDITQAFVFLDEQFLTTRLDVVDVENDAPTATDLTETVLEDGSVLITLTGNDSDGNPLTFQIQNPPSNGQLSSIIQINANSASVIYTPNVDYNGNDSFTYTSNDAQVNSSAANVNLVVTSVNDQPSFIANTTVNVLKDSGPYSEIWATALSAGPSDESSQVLSFNISNVTNSGLFSVSPVVDSSGNLSFTVTQNISGLATVSITLSDNGGTANGGVDTSANLDFDIVVGGVNDAPSFTAGNDENIFEDAGSQTVAGWATNLSPGPADENGQILTFNITNNTNPSLFSVQPSVDGVTGDLTYTPAADINGIASITLNVMDNGGTLNGGVDTSGTQSFNITVGAVNDAPTYSNVGDVAVLKDSGPYSDTWASAISPGPSDESAQSLNFNITNITNSGLFSVQPLVDLSGNLTFELMPNLSGVATVSINLMDDGGTANGGNDTSANVDFDILVGGVNDAPSFTVGNSQNILEDAGAQLVLAWATNLSPGPADEVGQTLTFNITNNSNPGLFSVPPSVDGITGDLTYTTATDMNGIATITLNVMDNGGTLDGGVDTSATQSFDISVGAVNDAPSFTSGGNVTVLEESSAFSSPWATALSNGPADESGQTLSFNITNNSNSGLFLVAPVVSSTGVLSFTPQTNASGTSTISINIMDDGGVANSGVNTSVDIMFDIIITDINDEPSFNAGADQSILEDAGPQSVVAWATSITAGPPSESAQSLSFNVSNDNNALFSVQPAVSANGTLTYTTNTNANGTATVTLNVMDDGGTANGGDNTSPDQMFNISVLAVNDAPSFVVGADENVLEDAGAQTVVGWATSIAAGPADESGQTISFNIAGNTAPALFASGPSINNAGQLTYTPAADAVGTATISVNIMDNGGVLNSGVDTSIDQMFTINIIQVNDEPSFTVGADQSVNQNLGLQTVNGWVVASSPGPANESGQTLSYNLSNNNNALFSVQPTVNAAGDLSYTSAMNMSGTAEVTINVMDNGGTANLGDDTSPDQTFNIDILNPPPSIAMPPSYSISTNIQNNVPAITGLLNGASGGTGTLTVGNGMNPAPTMTVNGGNLSINSTTGEFSYNPPAGQDTGTDTFTYKICDSAMPTSVCSADITTTFNISGNTIWFIDASAAAGDGRLTTPFNSIAAFASQQNGGMQGDPAIGDCVFLEAGNYTGPLTLLNNQKVIGKGSSTAISLECGLTPAVNSVGLPTAAGARPVLISAGNGINLGSGNTLRGFNIGNSQNKLVGFGFGTLTINNMALVGTGKAVDLSMGTTSATFDSINSSGSVSEGIDLSDVSGSFTVAGLTNIDNPTAIGVNIQNSNLIYNFADITVNNRNSAGVFINANTGGVQNGTFGNVLINNQNGSNTTAFGIDNTVTGGSTITVNSLTVNNNAASGSAIALSNNDGATININGGSVSNSIGATVSISSSAGNATYAGVIDNSIGRSVQILNNSGGTTTLSGNINDSGSGIFVNNNTGATVFFSGILNLSTTVNDAFTATGGGTVNAVSASSTINTTTGSGLKVVSTTIGANNLNFRSITTGATTNNAIILDSTGSIGRLLVTGTGTTDGSGGSIGNQNGPDNSLTQGIAIYLNNTSNSEFRNMTLSGIYQNHAVFGSNVSGLTLNNIDVTGTSGTNLVSDEGGVELNGISGTLNVIGGTYGGGIEDNFAINNSSGTLTANFNNVTFTANHATTGDNGLQFITSGTATGNLNVNGSSFNSARSVMLFTDIGGSGGGTVNLGNTSGNTFSQNQVNLSGGGAIEVLATGSGNASTVNTRIQGNTIVAGSGTFEGDTVVLGTTFGYAGTNNITFNGLNRIGTNGVNGSAVNPANGSGDSAIVITQNGTGTLNELINNNLINDFNSSGIEIFYDAEGPSDPMGGTYHSTKTNNIIIDAVGGSTGSIDFLGDDIVDTCMHISSNALNNPAVGEYEIVIDTFQDVTSVFSVVGLGTLDESGLEMHWSANNGGLVPVTDVRIFAVDPVMTMLGNCVQP